MSARPAVIADEVNVIYRVYEDSKPGIKQMFSKGRTHRKFRSIHAVKGVSFRLDEGESLGIIGSNGSGKSTLLMALTGLLPTESGKIKVRSRPTLLAVSAALRPGLSGRRNIIIGGLAMGMSKREIDERLDEICAFAELEDFIDLPMRTYSSGMRARLSFAIATAHQPEILLIDEALAVGDAHFKEKSAERINKIRSQAGAVILVSHDTAEVARSCERALWIEKGELRADGPTDEVVALYKAATHPNR
ncbi:MAG TPA: ABC transporter ATP-binding protein [Acidimicrobiia bacterium]|nr:ABC transporter ATP-binding protein [Acidimicrobiia bacterium]